MSLIINSPRANVKVSINQGLSIANLNNNQHARNKRSLHNYRFLKNNFMQHHTYNEDTKPKDLDLNKSVENGSSSNINGSLKTISNHKSNLNYSYREEQSLSAELRIE